MGAAAGVAAVWLASCLGVAAFAAPITFEFSGRVSQAPTLDPADPFGGAIDVGTTFTGRYSFDPAAPDLAPGAQTGSYNAVGAPYGLRLVFGSAGVFDVAFDEVAIGIGNDFSGADFYTVIAPLLAPDFGLTASLVLTDSDGSVFTGAGLPAGAPALDAFETRQFSLIGSRPNSDSSVTQIEIVGTVDSLACSAGCAVPEPGSVLLAATGLAALLARRRAPRPLAPWPMTA